jgi:predicted nucleotide-binding protein (sugar kinase/HSP70/actin superfamily)
MPTKIFFGGLTRAHDVLVEGVFKYLGIDAESLPEADNEALKLGKMYCNKGQCNPVYYTAGNVIRHLFTLKDRGEKNIEHDYMFITAGSCGPCRFGMYEMEYRKAVSDAGFKNFTIVALRQDHALLNDLKERGFDLPRRSLLRVLKSFILSDLINNLYYQMKPYEIQKGSIDAWKKHSLFLLYETLSSGTSIKLSLQKIYCFLKEIELDYFRPKPKVKITGEFFSQMQEGEANYRLPGWLIEEGAEPIVEPITTWLDYLLWGRIRFTLERAFRSPTRAVKTTVVLLFLKAYIRLVYRYYCSLLGNKPDLLTSQNRIAKYANPYYSTKLVGGEGHLEVGKHIYSIKHNRAHMIISVKPFGCMCSTQSDGVQTKATSEVKESIFVSVDTSGDAEVNFKSRILMKLYEAKRRVLDEYAQSLTRRRLSQEDVERFKSENSSRMKGTIKISGKGVSTAQKALHLIPSRAVPSALRTAWKACRVFAGNRLHLC